MQQSPIATLCLLFIVAAVLAGACGDDDNGVNDAGSIDAMRTEDAETDAFTPCLGQAAFEAELVDWESGDGLAGVEASSEQDTASSAPNGRLLLCVAPSGPVTIDLILEGYLPWRHSTSGEGLSQAGSGALPLQIPLLTGEQRDALYASVEVSAAAGQGTLLAQVRNPQSGAGLARATVATDAANVGAFVPGENNSTLVSGSTSGDDGRVLFLNAEVGTSSATVTGVGNCESPAPVDVVADGIGSVALICLP